MASRTFSRRKSESRAWRLRDSLTASSSPETPSLIGLSDSGDRSCRARQVPQILRHHRTSDRIPTRTKTRSPARVDQPEPVSVGQQPEAMPSAPENLQEPGIRRASPSATNLSRRIRHDQQGGTVALASA